MSFLWRTLKKVKGRHGHEEDLYRVSASWEIPMGNFEIAPTLAFDSIDGETATVVGIALIRPF